MALQGVTDLCKTSPSFLPIRGDLSLDQSRGLKKEGGGRSPGRSGRPEGRKVKALGCEHAWCPWKSKEGPAASGAGRGGGVRLDGDVSPGRVGGAL